ncbi:replication protein [Salmonella enterica subsp. enterica serovar Reading]|uniref:DNA replication protein n=1 Tax=Salmonella enterica subsp. enterica serovar Reading TaxID=165302 RepID=A0A5H6A5J1_SALET|nr:DNA replication protein [Salmonella enterica subsp. enterica serovar Reading]EBV6629212.1 DNA replication protein [Salmonella enterica subsp. enterica serovar Saintpaul]EBY9722714.1 DNA replication protein [Salmonella enterica subsp. enterica serovar Chester]EEA0895861.1 DNA replication protein [Salmonella enterica]EBV5572706.1 DNA replication protein [Salmonella enterica subsp. enterica serovar Reading]
MSNTAKIYDFSAAHERRSNRMENQKTGYIPLYRSILKQSWAKDVYLRTLWENLLLNAARKPYKANFKGHEWHLQPGQLVVTAADLGLQLCDRHGKPASRDQVERMLQVFVKEGMITIDGEKQKGRVITITHYHEYAQKMDNSPAHESAQTTAHDAAHNEASNGAAFSAHAAHESAHESAQTTAHHEQEGINKNINNISNTDVLESATADKKSDKKKPSVSCQDVVDAYHELLPEASRVRALNDKRKNQIRTFWRKAGVITRQLDGHGFTMQDWRNYLSYVGENCRWMFEERQNHQRGTVWHKKGFDFLLNDNTYLKVREGEHDDR